MLTSNDLALIIPMVFFAVYSAWITAEVLSVREEIETEKKAHQMTEDRLDKERRISRTYRQALLFYSIENNWDPLYNPKKDLQDPRLAPKGSAIAADQGQTAQLALGDFFLAPDAVQMSLVIQAEEGTNLGKYFFLLGQK